MNEYLKFSYIRVKPRNDRPEDKSTMYTAALQLRWSGILLGCLFAILTGRAIGQEPPSSGGFAQQIPNDPDSYIWKVFLELNRPADQQKGRGVPDPTKKVGDDGIVVWQTWMRTDEVFLDNGEKPPEWDAPPTLAPLGVAPVIRQRFRSPRKILLSEDPRVSLRTLRADEPPPLGLSESAMNRAAFEFVVSNELYNIEGQEAFHSSRKLINLPPAAKEIKSAWKILSPKSLDDLPPQDVDQFEKHYHTTTLQHQGKTYLYGLTGLHITTKDLPKWVWATFEHVDNPEPELPDNDRVGKPSKLMGTKWENYRLRGTQTDFTDSTGQPTVLANTQIETGFQQSASCITCHARATIGESLPIVEGLPKLANRLPFFLINRILHRRTRGSLDDQTVVYGYIGAVDEEWFKETASRRRYTQLDYMWSLRNAMSKQAGGPP